MAIQFSIIVELPYIFPSNLHARMRIGRKLTYDDWTLLIPLLLLFRLESLPFLST